MNHFISLDQAKKMTTLYRQQKENILKNEYQGKDILSISETFLGAAFLSVLNKPECVSLRIYYGMSEDLKMHAIIVGVDANNQDILPAVQTSSETFTDGDTGIIEVGQQCPPACPPPPPSPLYS